MQGGSNMIRSAKETDAFPYRLATICYFEVDCKGNVNRIPHKNKSDIDGVLEALKRAEKGITKIYAVWPGNWSSDLFIIDDLDKLAESFELFSKV